VLHWKEKTGIFTADTATQINNEFISKVCAMEGAAAGFAFASGMCGVFHYGCVIKFWNHIVSSSSVLVQRTSRCLLFSKMEHTNLVF
jgi:cystathionine beta-lyase/cystathionine gamma-synthase